MNDEIIDEVRSVKNALGEKYNYDLKALFQEIKRGENILKKKGIKIVSPPETSSTLPASSLQQTRFHQR